MFAPGYDDPDDPLNASPQLQAVKPNFGPEESPPPFIHDKSSTSSPSSERDHTEALANGNTPAPSGGKRSKKRKKTRIRPSQGDAVLIGYLAPNNPDIAQEAGKRPLEYGSGSEDSEDDEGSISVQDHSKKEMRNVKTESQEDPLPAQAAALKTHAQEALKYRPDPVVTVTEIDAESQKANGPTKISVQCTRNYSEETAAPSQTAPAHSPLSKHTSQISTDSTLKDSEKDDDTLLATSPKLAKYAIKESDAPDGSTLPALQKSPPRSSSIHSGDNAQSLPSIQTALGNFSEPEGMSSASPAFHPLSAQSPTMITRPPPFMSQHPGPSPSTYSQSSPASSKDASVMSPPGLPSHPTYWRSAPKIDPPYSTPSAGDAATPSTSTLTGESPTSAYPTPNVQDHRMSVEGESPQLLNGPLPNGPLTSTAFKCSHPGCTAAPFQTQYLLNSHANVHSSSRPHFCSVKGCPRSYGGKGFKRKNEMIRHGLVHDSPGYVCPFCPDQQHKYPRPDNLQRWGKHSLLGSSRSNTTYLDMFEFTMLIRIGMTLTFDMSWRSGLKVVIEDVADAMADETVGDFTCCYAPHISILVHSFSLLLAL
ncbi:MAG: hypothetical protein Q9227_007535 [Pyrenula ochraceoflavens]